MPRKLRAPFRPGFPPGAYTRAGLKNVSDKDLQHEYARIRAEAQSRLRALGKSPRYSTSEAYRANVGQYPTLKEIGSDRKTLENLVIQGVRFVSAKGSSPSGLLDIDEKRVKSLQAAGYTFVNMDNLQEFGNFMEWYRGNADAATYASDMAATAFSEATGQGATPQQIERLFFDFMDQIEGKNPLDVAMAKKEHRRAQWRESSRRYRAKKKAQRQAGGDRK